MTSGSMSGEDPTEENLENSRRDMPRGGRSQVLARGLIAGLLAGLAALWFDLVLARWMLGFPIGLETEYAVAYLATGALLGALVAALHWLRHRQDRRSGIVGTESSARTWSWSILLIWTAPVVDRLGSHAMGIGLPSWSPIAFGPVAILVLLIFGSSRWGERLPGFIPALVGFAASAGLAIHRNVVDVDFSFDSLHLDVGIMACAVFTGWALASRGRRRWIVATMSAVVLVLLAREVKPDALPDRVAEPPEGAKDLILIVADTLRHDVFRKVLEETPEGAAFQQRFGHAVHFDRLTAVAPWTVPSMGSVLTGLYPSQHGFGRLSRAPARLQRLDAGVPTLATRLRNRGYRTIAWVANPILYPETGINRGFDSYRLLQPATTKLPLLTLYASLGWVEEELYQPADALVDLLAQSTAQLEEASPFFLWLHLMDPHKPYRYHEGLTPPVGAEFPGEDEALYFGEVRFTLAQLTRIVEELNRAGLWHDAAVVFVADHGEMFSSDERQTGSKSHTGEPRNTGHGNGLYAELIHVPLVIRPPGGLDRTVHVDRPVSHVDLYDTFGDLIGVDLPPPSEGARYSVEPWIQATELQGEPADDAVRPWSVSGFLQHKPPQRALVGRQLKVIDFEGDRAELYDLEADPWERHDLSNQRVEAIVEGLKLLDAYWLSIDGSRRDGESAAEGEGVELDEETRRRLEALGYL
ncbi:MAG: sulfatase [Thermoanaerobaculia bacterium]|nr:sulfatase [Thermoanaerobaculia bacterium]